MGETSNIDRFQTTVDLWLADATHQAQPLFVSVGLENFVDSPDWNEANKQGVEYLIRQARTRKVAFASAADIADFFQRHYDRQPENWLYWPDIYCGYEAGYKPAQVPDRIELSNAQFHCEHVDGAALPRFFWDYTRPWSEPVWDQAAIREKHGLADPDRLTAGNCVPRMVDLAGFQARVEMRPEPDGVQLRVEVDAPRAIASLPVGRMAHPAGGRRARRGRGLAPRAPRLRGRRLDGQPARRCRLRRGGQGARYLDAAAARAIADAGRAGLPHRRPRARALVPTARRSDGLRVARVLHREDGHAGRARARGAARPGRITTTAASIRPPPASFALRSIAIGAASRR